MSDDKFRMHNYYAKNYAETNGSVANLKPFYKIFIWLPHVIIAIYGLVGIIVIACLDIEILFKVLSILGAILEVFLAIFLTLVIQSITRLNMYHIERINYNTSKIQDQLDQILLTMSGEKIGDTTINNDLMNEDYIKATSGIESMLKDKIINDNQFDIYIKMLERLGSYKNSNDKIILYKSKYNDLKLTVVDETSSYYETLMIQISDLYQGKKITKDKYLEYVDVLNNISKIQDKDEQEKAYKKLKIILSMY